MFGIESIPLHSEPFEDSYEYRFVAFIDMLGFRELVRKSETDILTFGKIYEALQQFYGPWYFATSFDHGEKFPLADFRIKSFSDNIVVSTLPTVEGFILLLALVNLITTYTEIPWRGGITIGNVFHSNSAVFGPAMIQAYDLERTVAVNPRVIIDRAAIRWIFSHMDEIPDVRKHLAKLLRQDADGQYRVTLDGVPNLSEDSSARTHIPDSVSAQERQKIEGKLEWLRARWKEEVERARKGREWQDMHDSRRTALMRVGRNWNRTLAPAESTSKHCLDYLIAWDERRREFVVTCPGFTTWPCRTQHEAIDLATTAAQQDFLEGCDVRVVVLSKRFGRKVVWSAVR